LNRKQLETTLARLRREGTDDLPLLISFFKTCEAQRVGDNQKKVCFELAKLLVLTSTDEHFVEWFRGASKDADNLRWAKEFVQTFEMPEEAIASEFREKPREAKVLAWCRSIRTEIEKEIYGEGSWYFSRGPIFSSTVLGS